MKKELLAVCAVACAAAAFATDYTSENAVACLGVSKGAGKQMLAVPFKGFSAESITVSNVVACANLAVGDKLYLAVGGSYKAWQVTSGTNGKYWAPIADVSKTGGVGSAPSATATEVVRGDGLWLDTQQTTAYLLGEKAEGETKTMEVAIGLNLVGIVSATTPRALKDIGGASGDMIILSNGTSYTYGKTSGKWMSVKGYADSSNVTIPAGTGFWYNSKSGGSITL